MCACGGEVGAFGGEGGEKVCVCMLVVGSARQGGGVRNCRNGRLV